MTKNPSLDTRWIQRLDQYKRALAQLEEAVDLFHERALSKLEKQGLIKAFEFTHELAWKVLKDFFEYQGNPSLIGSRDATREAFQVGLVEDGEAWMEMILSRNQTSHTYNESTATEIAEKVSGVYFVLLKKLEEKMTELSHGSSK